MLKIIDGDIFDAKEKYLLHQTNCITKRAAHLSKTVFENYPYADIYAGRTTPDKPGTIIIRGNGLDERYVVNMLGQYYPGHPKYPDSDLDGTIAREKYFYQCLLRVANIPDLISVAIPHRIGCGAGGGNWEVYLGTIKNFEKYVNDKFGTIVRIYKL
jgi:hypothetical protein